MQPAIRINIQRLPRQVAPAICTRKLNTTPRNMAFFPQLHTFNPLFRFMDEVERSFPASSREAFCAPTRAFSPRVNVSEEQQQYLLQAEVPGYEQKDVSIEWTDANTLTISGRTGSQVETSDSKDASAAAAVETAPAAPASPVSEHQPSVEDAVDEDSSKRSTNDEWVNLPTVETDSASTPAPTAEKQAVQPAPAASHQTVQQATPPQSPKYWVKERSVGQFSRSFSFPARVDHENVKASLKNGILSVIIPKVQLPKTRRIVVE